MTVVQIDKPENANLADWFAELRAWFDVNDCSPLLFAKAGTVMNRDRFNIKFADDVQAHLFTSSFAKYGPSLRSIGEEQSEAKDSTAPTGPAADPPGQAKPATASTPVRRTMPHPSAPR
jgi:hypothetical protein